MFDYWCAKGGLQQSWNHLLEDVEMGAWTVVWPSTSDMQRARALQSQYEDSRGGCSSTECR